MFRTTEVYYNDSAVRHLVIYCPVSEGTTLLTPMSAAFHFYLQDVIELRRKQLPIAVEIQFHDKHSQTFTVSKR